jgi:ureidoacrylate peracid hydrolase
MRDVNTLKHIDFTKAALLVIDMQNDFVHPDGANGRWIRQRWEQDGDKLGEFNKAVEKMVSSTRELVAICRANRVPVIWIRVVLADATDCKFWGAEGYFLCREGHWGSEWYDGFGPRADEIEVLKTRHSAFHKTRLQQVLQELGRETLLLAGTATHGCVEGTARDAMANDYWVVVAGEACGQLDMEAHQQALVRINRLFGYVLDVPTISRALTNAAQQDTSRKG